jgi:hypothetical protein
MKLFGCSHKRFTSVQADGFQYCANCNKAFLPVGGTKNVPSSHILEDVDTYDLVTPQGCTQSVTKQACTRCGRLFLFNDITGQYRDESPDKSTCTIVEQSTP